MEEYYWDTANATRMGDYLTREVLKFINKFLDNSSIYMPGCGVWQRSVQRSDLQAWGNCCGG